MLKTIQFSLFILFIFGYHSSFSQSNTVEKHKKIKQEEVQKKRTKKATTLQEQTSLEDENDPLKAKSLERRGNARAFTEYKGEKQKKDFGVHPREAERQKILEKWRKRSVSHKQKKKN